MMVLRLLAIFFPEKISLCFTNKVQIAYTMSDSSLTCVQWTTADDQKRKYVSQQTQGLFIAIFGGMYLIGALGSFKKVTLVDTMSLAIAGAIAMGTGVTLVNQKNDATVYGAKTQNLLTTGWASVLVPAIFSLHSVVKEVYKSRINTSKFAYNEPFMMPM